VSRCVVITDGEQRSTLALARSLGKVGHRVVVCASNRRSLAGMSRYADECVTTPSPLDAPDAFADAVANATHRYSADVLLPVVEASLLAILPRRKEIDPCVIPFPSSERFAEICDKSLVLAAAGRRGIATPRQHVLRQRGDLDQLNGALRFPVVAKPARSVSGGAAGRFKGGSEYADDQVGLVALIDRVRSDAYPMLVQERIVGPGIGIFVLMWNGELRAAFSHRRIREKPPSGGVSVVSQSVALDAALLERSVQLLRDFDWRGVAMVEYKLDARTGTPYLMEVNGRFWGSLQLAIDAGVDFPNILVNAACGLPTPGIGEYETGIRLRWEWGDVDNLVVRLRRSAAGLRLPAGAPGRLRGLIDFARAFGPGTRGEVLRLDDPMPFVHETLNWLRGR
jgi:predicted ATP-grasp superfamily ATP-dependent carboligase